MKHKQVSRGLKGKMQSKFMKKFKTFLIWISIFSVSLTALLGVNLSHAKADTLPTVQFSSTNGHGLESVANPLIPVTLSDKAASDVTIDCTIDLVKTTADTGDYNLSPSMIISAGDTTGNLPLQITYNTKVDGNRIIVINLENPSGATLSSPSEFTYTILDDDLITTLSTAPVLPDGQNNWFVSAPQITLAVNDVNADIYYQWSKINNPAGAWLLYNSSISASEGDNWLCYYAEDVNIAEIENTKCREIKVDTILPAMTTVTATLTSNNQVQLSWNPASDIASGIDHYEIYRGGTLLESVAINGYLDKIVTSGQNYVYQVVAVDVAGNQSQPETINIFVPAPVIVTPAVITETESVTPPVIGPAISSGVSTYKPSVVTPEVKAAETPEVTNNNGEETSESSNWNKLLLAISILIIAAGAAVGGYYGYQWWMIKKDDEDKPKEDKSSSKSRW